MICEYYYRATSEEEYWLVDLYKVREALKKAMGSEGQAKRMLDIGDAEWRRLGRILNNKDMRHAVLDDRECQVFGPDKNWLKQTAWQWIASNIRQRRGSEFVVET